MPFTAGKSPPPKILVADDSKDAADATAALLSLSGYDVRAVYDGLEAVEAARTFHPDLVILDINMPVMNGYEAAAALRKEQAPGSNLVLVALTGRTNAADAERSREVGFDLHLGKPLLHDFSNLIGSLLAQGTRQDPQASKLRAPSS